MNLDELPSEIGKLEKLESLILGKWDDELSKSGKNTGNNLKTLPSEFSKLHNLRKLEMGFNELRAIPEEIIQLEKLEYLDLYNNKINKIPETISQLLNLKRLYLESNSIKEIPEEITKISNLKVLLLGNNLIKKVPRSISNLSNLKALYLSKNQIYEFPEEFAKLSNLSILYLLGNQLKEISQSIIRLSRLKTLVLSHNQISYIPDSISNLSCLNTLSLYNNSIQEIPPIFSNLKNLTHLYIGRNQIEEIPEAITQLPNLSVLYLGGNHIQKIPGCIAQLSNLSELSLYENKIEKIPETILQLSNLKKLTSAKNKIADLPIWFEKLSNLEKLDLRHNPLPLSPEILGSLDSRKSWQDISSDDTGSVTNIFNYLRQLKSGNVRPLNEAKLMLVGQGSVGKTSIINRLLHQKFNRDEVQTDGLNVWNWKINVNTKDIRLNVWDFGGQEIYHATHQFFLTKRSLYLLVCNCRTSEEENRLEYWLKLIQTFGDASPVIIVGNKKDEQPLDINRKALREKYPNICAILETSCQSGDGIKELSEAIHQEVAKLKEVYDLLPLSWFEVKEQLEAMTEDFITYNRYIGICHENKIPEEENQNQLIDLLHRLGLVLNFREHPLLQQTNVLKPEWATEGIYALLSDDQLKTKSKGIFCCEDLTRILDAARYPKERHQYLVELMKEFELSFALNCNPPCFLIPGILPKDEPAATNLEGATLEFQYHYRVLPNSIISRFIVNTHEKIHNETYWRSGVMLAYKESDETCNIARVKADPEDNKIFIAISGKPETRRTFLGLIRDVFNTLHKSFGNLEITEWVPVPGHPEHPPLDYQELLGLEEMGTEDYPIGKLKITVNVRDLLDGYESRQQRQRTRDEAARIDKQYNFYGDVKDPDFIGGNNMAGDTYDQSGSKFGIGVMKGGTIESGSIVAGEYNNNGADLESILKLIETMRQQVSAFSAESQDDIEGGLDDIADELNLPAEQRNQKKLFRRIKALAMSTVAAFALVATPVMEMTDFANNITDLAEKVEPAQVQVIQEIVQKVLPAAN